MPQRKRFVVGLPLSLVGGNALQHAARRLHLLLEFGEQRFGDRHFRFSGFDLQNDRYAAARAESRDRVWRPSM